MADECVRVAVRIRPLVQSEINTGCQVCLDVVPGEPQVQLRGTEKSFTYNHVFGADIEQEDFYNTAVKGMVENIFKGYNVTILAYGQTGSGKTHSMGTCYNGGPNMGVIPRAIQDIFKISEIKQEYDIKVSISFLELYQEQLYDLLVDKPRNQCIVDIREDSVKGITIVGLTEIEVNNITETFECLTRGSLRRATGATAMNAHSSRSHAIFTIYIRQEKKGDPNSATVAKFHLVDLAGSERSKKTGATGERFKEGVNINKGLLALGNVISLLGEGKSTYIGYRDSKLTRLLQDSLGGNSITLMIACVSPADYNLDETVSTLRYADRARRIKNKPIVNQDAKLAEISRLNKMIQELKMAMHGQGGTYMCPPEHRELENKVHSLQEKIRALTYQLNTNLIELVRIHERAEASEEHRQKLINGVNEISEEVQQMSKYFDANPEETEKYSGYKTLQAILNKILELQNIENGSNQTSELLATSNKDNDLSSGTKLHDDENQLEEADSKADLEDMDLDQKQEEYTIRQAERNEEMCNLNSELARKEDLIAQLVVNASNIVEYSKELQEMENEIKTLQSEKEELLRTLENVRANKISSKLAESRRIKVQELEKRIGELSRKCMEQSKVVRMKEKADQRVRVLTNEIHSMKQTRVSLMKQMRRETESFNRWKKSKEQELSKLKDQERKRQYQMMRMENHYSKQQNVLKRKVQEAHAMNKRLKDALELQRKVKQHASEKNTNPENIKDWISKELELRFSVNNTELTLQRLLQDRSDHAVKLEKLKTDKMARESPTYQNDLDELVQNVELRSAQIAQLQREILESDQENMSKSRWQTVRSMADAKTALNILFETAGDIHKREIAKIWEYEELIDTCDQQHLKIRQAELQASALKAEYEQKLAKLQSEYEQDVMDCIEHLRGTSENSNIDNTEIAWMKRELKMYKDRCQALEQEREEGWKNNKSANNSKTTDDKKKKKSRFTVDENQDPHGVWDDSFSDDSIVVDDDDADPDWRKTPMYKRVRKTVNVLKDLTKDGVQPLKRSSNGEIKCSCKTDCSTRMCTCRRQKASCSNCNCQTEICKNRNTKATEFDYFPDDLQKTAVGDASKRLKLERHRLRRSGDDNRDGQIKTGSKRKL